MRMQNFHTWAMAAALGSTAFLSATALAQPKKEDIKPRECKGSITEVHPRKNVTVKICVEPDGRRWIQSAIIPVTTDKLSKETVVKLITSTDGIHALLDRAGLTERTALNAATDKLEKDLLIGGLRSSHLIINDTGLHIKAAPSTSSAHAWPGKVITLTVPFIMYDFTSFEIARLDKTDDKLPGFDFYKNITLTSATQPISSDKWPSTESAATTISATTAQPEPQQTIEKTNLVAYRLGNFLTEQVAVSSTFIFPPIQSRPLPRLNENPPSPPAPGQTHELFRATSGMFGVKSQPLEPLTWPIDTSTAIPFIPTAFALR